MTATSAAPDESAAALGQYLGAIRARTLVVVLVTLATVGAAAAFLATRAATYKSTAELLVAPLPQDDRTFLGTALLRDSGDPTRTVQTAAAVVASPLAAQDTARRLGGGLTSGDVQQNINVQPLGDSNILSVTASATSAAAATRLADQYVRSALAVRGRQLQRQVDAAIAAIGPKPAASDAAPLAELRAVRQRGDPTLTLSQAAQTPRAATGAPAPLVLVLAAIAGFTLGSIAALLMERFDRRVRDAGELLALAPIPIVLRVPTTGRNGRRASSDGVAWSVREAFRTLQIELDQRRAKAGGASQTVMVTSASSADGKTSTALSLAFALVGAGHRVILMDCDLRKPDIAPRLGLEPSDSLVALVTSGVALSELLQPARANLQVLAAARGSRDNSLLHGLDRQIGNILEEALKLADYVVIDSAPLGEVGDPLTIAGHVDALLLVVRPQHTNRGALQTTVELLERAHTTPAGWVVIGEEGIKLSSSYHYAEGVLGDVGKRLRDHVVGGRLDRRRRPPVEVHVEHDLERGPLGERRQGEGQPALGEYRGMALAIRTGEETRQVQMVCLDELVGEDDVLRRIERLVSWEMVRETAAPFYSDIGRPGIDPVVLVKVFLVAAIRGIDSMRETLRVAEVDLAIRRFLGYGLTERLPHHATFSYAQCVRFANSTVFEQLFMQVLASCREAGLLDGSRLIVDGTHVEANATLSSLRAELALIDGGGGSDEDAGAGGEEPAVGRPQQAPAAPGSGPTPKRKVSNATATSRSDPDAKLRDKPGHRPHLVHGAQVATDPKARVIVAVNAERATGHEADSLPVIIDRAKWLRHRVDQIVADAGYASDAVYTTLAERGITAYIPPQPNMRKAINGAVARERCRTPAGVQAAIDRITHGKGAISELKRHGAGRARCRGSRKLQILQIQLLLAATAINLRRLITRDPAAENAAGGRDHPEQATIAAHDTRNGRDHHQRAAIAAHLQIIHACLRALTSMPTTTSTTGS